MTSLIPGAIFHTTGLNRNSTPTPPNTTPAQLDSRYDRGDFDGKTWPHSSPVSRMYDVRNSSTKMIILNNRFGQSGTRLRGYYSGPQKPNRSVDPERHRAPSPRNPDYHIACLDSSSPKFEPSIRTNLDWSSCSQRPDNALDDLGTKTTPKTQSLPDVQLDLNSEISVKSQITRRKLKPKTALKVKAVRTSVNPRRHTSCMTPRETSRYPPEEKRIPIPPAKFMSAKEFSDMSLGEKIYLWSIERIYNVENMKRLKQDQYKKLLQLEAKKGYHGYQEYQRYMRYINSASSRDYGTSASQKGQSPAGSRARSAYSTRSATRNRNKQEDKDDKADSDSEDKSRPKTAIGMTRSNRSDNEDDDSKSKKRESEQKQQQEQNQSKSPSPSRKSSARSTRSAASNRSVKSRSSYRPASTTSSKRSDSGQKKDETSDSSLSTDADKNAKHREGRDRPKSRLGHVSKDNREDKVHSSLSSLSSVYSDKHSLSSSDSGLEKDKNKRDKKQRDKKQRHSTSSTSLSSITSKSSKSSTSISSSSASLRSDTRQQQGKGKGGSGETKAKAKPVGTKNADKKSDEKDKEGEIEKSNASPEAEKKAVKISEDKDIDKSDEKDVKIHRVPSAPYERDESADEKQDKEKDDNKGNDDDKYVTDKTETVQKKVVISEDSPKKHEEPMKTEQDNNKDTPQEDKNDETKEDAVSEKKEDQLEKRRDSLDEVDEDRRVNKDLDKIEY